MTTPSEQYPTREDVERSYRAMIFDKFVDLALDGVITMDQAIKGYREECLDDDATA